MPEPVSQIIEVPQNEPQPNRETQLDNDLSKLFETSEPVKKADSKPVEVQKPVEKVEPEKAKEEVKPSPDKVESKSVESEGKPKDKEGWRVLRESHAQAKKTIVEKDQELAKLKAVLADKGQTTSKEAEDLKKEIDELKGYRSMVDIQADPEFIAKFDEPILAKQGEVAEILNRLGVDKATIDKIDYTDSKAISLAAHAIREKSHDDIAADEFLSAAREARKLILDREKHLQEYKGKYKETIETKKKESFAKQAESEGRVQKHLQTIADLKDDNGESRFPFLSEQVAKDPTNAAEVEQVDRHNKAVGMLRQKLDVALKAESPEDRAELAVAAVSAHWITAQLKAAIKKIDSLQAELAKVSKVTSETPRSQKLRTSTNGNGNDSDLDLDNALSNFRAGR